MKPFDAVIVLQDLDDATLFNDEGPVKAGTSGNIAEGSREGGTMSMTAVSSKFPIFALSAISHSSSPFV